MNFPLPNYGQISVYKRFTAITLEQTRKCHNKCIFCSRASAEHQNVSMDKSDLSFILDMFPGYSEEVSFGSGEVFMLKDLPERVQMVKKSWPKCKLQITTTFNISRGEEYIRELFHAGLDSLYISCYAYTNDDYKKVHGSDNFSNLEENISVIENLPKSMSDKIVFRYFKNYGSLFNIKEAENKFNIFKRKMENAGIKNFDPRQCFPWSIPQPLNGYAAWHLPFPCDVVWGNRSRALNILYNLDVIPCCMMRNEIIFGNLKTMSLEEIFTGDTYKSFYRAWWQMQPEKIPVCNSCQVYATYAERDELARMAAWQAREVRGQKVIFWGGGEAYRAYKSFFVDCEPVAMLMDTPNATEQKEIDGIPVYRPDVFLPALTEPLPLVIFAMQEASPKILQTLKEKYSFYKPSRLIICPANAHIVAPVKPFFQD